MFGLGFTEILLIAVVALLFIGPDKLPETMKTIARTLGKVKRAFDDTKSTIENELRIDDLRQEALSYRQEIEKAKADLSAFKNVANKEINDIKKSAQSAVYQPSGINDDDDLFAEFEKAEKELEEVESKELSKEQREAELKELNKSAPKKIEATYAEPAQQLAQEAQTQEEKTQTIDFKHLKPKDS